MKNNLVYLQYILEAIEKIDSYLTDFSYEEFCKNNMAIDAVVRELEIIGEAARNIDFDFQEKYPDISWSKLVGMRNRLIHEYFGIDLKIVLI